jgi:hypothetical protein
MSKWGLTMSLTRASEQAGNHHGIFVGINKYAHHVQLAYCVNDAVEMRDKLTNEATGIIREADADIILDEEATKACIIKRIESIVPQLHMGDSLTFYVASHGTRPEDDEEELYLATHDTYSSEHAFEGAIRFVAELVPIFATTKAFIKVILDGCSVGDALARPIISANNNIGIMAASKKRERALEDERLKHGIFTFHLLLTLGSSEVDSDDDAYIGMEEAHAYCYPKVVNYAVRNLKGQKQHPTVGGNAIHEMQLIKAPIATEIVRGR